MFKVWSESNPEKKSFISPKLEIREWKDLDINDKENILKNFQVARWLKKGDKELLAAIDYIKNKYKKENYCPKTIESSLESYNQYSDSDRFRYEHNLEISAYKDFQNIWMNCEQDVVYEFISLYAKGQENEDFQLFLKCFNNIFEQYCLNLQMTSSCLVPRQEVKIKEDVYDPVFEYLADSKWKGVSSEISEATVDYGKKDYDDCIAKMSNAVQAYLQILVHGKTGKSNISTLIPEASKKNLIPNNNFINEFIEIIESYLGKERKMKGGVHPVQEVATEGDARFVMNLVMVVLQYWLQNLPESKG